MSLEIHEEQVGAVHVVIPTGRLDTNTAKLLDERLASVTGAQGCRIVIDMTDVDYVSSFGLRVLLMAAKKVSAKDGRLVLCGLKHDVLNVFRISGFLKILTVVDDRDAALAAIGDG